MTKSKKKDPPVKRSSKCAVCGQPRPHLAVAHNDPFCSNTCCRIWYEDEPTIKEVKP
jgi:endogenous inhibitor of DNA gyrase (YacG/DUF329 family)